MIEKPEDLHPTTWVDLPAEIFGLVANHPIGFAQADNTKWRSACAKTAVELALTPAQVGELLDRWGRARDELAATGELAGAQQRQTFPNLGGLWYFAARSWVLAELDKMGARARAAKASTVIAVEGNPSKAVDVQSFRAALRGEAVTR